MLVFRPLPGLTAACAVAFAILAGLGAWQLFIRLPWKLDLIAQVNRNLHAAPISLDTVPLAQTQRNEYARVTLTGAFDNAKEAYIYGLDATGAPVYHVIVPLRMRDGRIYLIDRGTVPKERLDPATRREGQLQGEQHTSGVWRTPDSPGWFTPAPDLRHRIWYAHDLGAIANADGVTLAAPIVIEADATPNPGGWPRGGQTRVEFRNEHLQYAITWFGLAAALIGVYIAYHVSRGRLRWRS
jgi:surfeit locus 1 family protein